MAGSPSYHTHGHSWVEPNFICKAGGCVVPRFCGSMLVVLGDRDHDLSQHDNYFTVIMFPTTRCLGTTLELKTRF